LTDPTNESATIRGGIIDGITYSDGDIALPADSPIWR